jgi:hypothetical protein
MSLEDAVGSVVLLGGAVYVLDKVTGKKRRILGKGEIRKRAKQVKRKVRKVVRRK